MKQPERHMTLLALALGPSMHRLHSKGVYWRFDPHGFDAVGQPHMGLIVVSKGPATMLLKMVASDRIELWADGLGETKGRRAYSPEKVTGEFVMRAVERLLQRCR